MNDAGRIGFVPKGTFDATIAYEFLDVVRYANGTYIAKQATIGNLPTDTNYWQLAMEDASGGIYVTFSDFATINKAGVVKIDNNTIKIDSNGVISAASDIGLSIVNGKICQTYET